MTHQMHPFHMVTPSPWPILGAISTLILTSGLVVWMHLKTMALANLGLTTLLLTASQWWRDIIREGTLQGHHTKKVQKSLQYGMVLFITSEILFFFGFFWTFFFLSLNPSHSLGLQWPPKGVSPMDPFEVPLLNTMVLLASGLTVTWAHHSIMDGARKNSISALTVTILLGLYFTALQAMEYYEAPFSISDGAYGSTFFLTTGFHGLHVIIGTTFLATCLIRQKLSHFTTSHHFGFEAAAWYWHFVDLVWIFLFTSVYWWGT
uniref:Cytochrome c oxidase subunit 3 n=1 Tax=Pseudocalotes microlepis TaxID=1963763 RepID=A0A384T9H8_9SAUR|nr:cytochrome c oxidase subunit III [Pseudocalotes microlepis]AQU64360.1 cytochrome c oxidase subunit III [Pseudocalotes microlepis]QGN67003.1 cytochrome c oxidase subunit III [Pseudocalotes microlepis]